MRWEIGEQAFDSDLLPITNLAHIKGPKMLKKILKRDPERAIISKHWFDRLDRISSPIMFIIVAPISLPFKTSPRIPNV